MNFEPYLLYRCNPFKDRLNKDIKLIISQYLCKDLSKIPLSELQFLKEIFDQNLLSTDSSNLIKIYTEEYFNDSYRLHVVLSQQSSLQSSQQSSPQNSPQLNTYYHFIFYTSYFAKNYYNRRYKKEIIYHTVEIAEYADLDQQQLVSNTKDKKNDDYLCYLSQLFEDEEDTVTQRPPAKTGSDEFCILDCKYERSYDYSDEYNYNFRYEKKCKLNFKKQKFDNLIQLFEYLTNFHILIFDEEQEREQYQSLFNIHILNTYLLKNKYTYSTYYKITI